MKKLTAEAEYCINFPRLGGRVCLSLHYNGNKSFFFVNETKICQFKAKKSEIKPYSLCLGNISKIVRANNMKKTGLNGYVHDFSVDYNIIDSSNIIVIHKYLMEKHNIA